MSDLYNQIVNDRGSFERLLARLPGFEGYLDRGARRKADRMLREHLAAGINERIKRLASIERRLLDQGGLKYMTRTQSAKSQLQMYADRIAAAPQGYSGFFDAVKIGTEELDLLYGFDELQIVYADRLTQALDTFERAVRSSEGVDAAIDGLDALAREANDAFAKRDSTILNLGITKE